jgi:hypothetical protein
MRTLGKGAMCAIAVAALATAAVAAHTKPKNKAPFGALDAPVAGAKITGKTRSSGWALDEDGKVTHLELLLDGKTLKKLKQDAPRPDVCGTYKVPACPKVGFDTTVDFSKVKKGPHTLSVKVTDNRGAKAEIGKREITVE